MSKKWLRRVKGRPPEKSVTKGEYESGAKMEKPHEVTKVDFLPSGILKEIKDG